VSTNALIIPAEAQAAGKKGESKPDDGRMAVLKKRDLQDTQRKLLIVQKNNEA